jgi:hypothetical protein
MSTNRDVSQPGILLHCFAGRLDWSGGSFSGGSFLGGRYSRFFSSGGSSLGRRLGGRRLLFGRFDPFSLRCLGKKKLKHFDTLVGIRIMASGYRSASPMRIRNSALP